MSLREELIAALHKSKGKMHSQRVDVWCESCCELVDSLLPLIEKKVGPLVEFAQRVHGATVCVCKLQAKIGKYVDCTHCESGAALAQWSKK